MKLEEIDYYLGLDCGTSSVGYAVTDKDYNLLKARHKDMWGSHLFDEAETAEGRRIQRNARKRLQRRNERIKLLQSIFAEEIAKVDPTFFLRLNESSLWEEDRSSNNKQSFSLFNDPNFTDKDYFKRYKTIYHLRADLVYSTEKKDPRLIYLALHHIVKNRGHFLFPGDSFSSVTDISPVLEALKESYYSVFDEELTIPDKNAIVDCLYEKVKSTRVEKLKANIFAENDKRKTSLVKAIVGYKIQTKNLFENEEYEDLPAIEFSNNSFEENALPTLEDGLTDDEYKLIESLKALYDWALLSSIMAGKRFISEAKVELYEKNKRDLKDLKDLVKEYAPASYQDMFHGDKDGFSNYIGFNRTNKKSQNKRVKRVDTEKFYKSVKKVLESIKVEDPRKTRILEDIANDNFLVLLRSFRNGVIPYQVNKAEMEQILNNASTYLSWLKVSDKDGNTPESKILSILTFRIPYYVGPLNGHNNKNYWMVRKDDGKIYPWNFDKKVDEIASAENFIQRMTNKCTYLPTEDVVAKQTLLYQKFMVLNEINNIKINGEDITVAQKQDIYNLFKQGNVTRKKIEKLAVAKCWVRNGESVSIDGIDETIKSKLSSYITFRDYLESGKLTESDVDTIIYYLTLFSDGGRIVKSKLLSLFKDKLSEKEIDKISKLKFSGWGNLSRKFLEGIEAMNPETGELTSIIGLLWDTNFNLMELVHNEATGIPNALNNKKQISSLTYNLLDEYRISPKVKRQIWQALKIVKEIEKIMGHKPNKIFIETTRSNSDEQKGKRTKSRKDQLLELLKKKSDPEINEIIKTLESRDSSEVTNRDRLYLYFTQLGKCMYSGEPIDLEDLLSSSPKNYDIDHIYPYSKSKDDSLTNKVIVKSNLNREKSNIYPISEGIINKMTPFWKKLADMNLIPSEKLHRLTRRTPLTDQDLQGFINRQLVETSQTTITLARILENYCGEESKVVYSKAGNVSEFRKDNELYKSRVINDLHHAKDAYLNIVVGNTLHTKYTSKYFLRDQKSDNSGNFNYKFKSNVEGAWIADNNTSMNIVKNTMNKNTVLFTRQPEMRTGQLFDLNLKGKSSEIGMIPSKMSDYYKSGASSFKEWTDKYGGYNSLAISHFALVKHKDKKSHVYTFVRIPMIRAKELLNRDNLAKYCRDELNYEDFEIVREKVLFNTLLSVDGFLMTITNSMNKGATLGLESAVPLLLKNDITEKIKKIEKFSAKKAKDKNATVDQKLDCISSESNEEIYLLLMCKTKLPIYKNRPASATKIIEEGFEKFKNLSLEGQVSVIMSILNYLGMTNGTSDFKLIGGGPANGTLTLSTTIAPSKKKIFIIDQSVTGIYDSWFELK